MNDNTSAAILAGKYITGHEHGGKCDMHRADLIIKHATGLVERKRNKVVVDSNDQFMKLYKTFQDFASWLMNKVARNSRYNKLDEWCKKNKKRLTEIPIPNTTRVAGCALLMQALIRNKFIMADYASQAFGADAEFKRRFPKQKEWELLSQFEGILYPLQSCAMSLQSDDPGTNSASLLEIFHARRLIQKMKKPVNARGGVLILSMNTADYGGSEDLWDGGVTIKKLENKRRAIEYSDLQPEATLLIRRLLREYDNYFMKDKDPDADKAILCNPFLAYIVPKMLIWMGVFQSQYQQTMYDNLTEDMCNNYCKKPSRIGVAFSVQARASSDAEDIALEAAAVDMEPTAQPARAVSSPRRTGINDDFELFQMEMRQLDNARAQSLAGVTGRAASAEAENVVRRELRLQCKKELEGYINHCERESADMAGFIMRYPTALYVQESSKWSTLEKRNFIRMSDAKKYLAMGKYFNVLAWWKENCTKYPRIYISAMVWLGKPATNAFQERVFSRASWYDSNRLMTQQSNKNFEMRTMDAASREIVELIKKREVQIEKEEEERRIARGELYGEVIELLDDTPDAAECIATQTCNLVQLTQELATFNNSADPEIEGPVVESTFLTTFDLDPEKVYNEGDVSFGEVDDVSVFDPLPDTGTLDPNADTDADLLASLQEKMAPMQSEVQEAIVIDGSVAAASIVKTPSPFLKKRNRKQSKSKSYGDGSKAPPARSSAHPQSPASNTRAKQREVASPSSGGKRKGKPKDDRDYDDDDAPPLNTAELNKKRKRNKRGSSPSRKRKA